MSASLAAIPQASAYFELESDALLALKDELKAQNDHVTFTSVAARVMATVLRDFPLLNSAVIDGNLVTYDSCNVGIGVGLERGIMMVVIREAQDKSVFQISDELKEKTDLLKQGKLPLNEMKDSTFTISSIGVQGIRHSTVIINPPETAMLAIGVTERRVVVRENDETCIRGITGFTLSHNHAVMDGYHVGAVIDLMARRLKEPLPWMGLGA
jgi:pyruvate dehydrogenase E2 component (dihydrolipoamide acetyltransferase)